MKTRTEPFIHGAKNVPTGAGFVRLLDIRRPVWLKLVEVQIDFADPTITDVTFQYVVSLTGYQDRTITRQKVPAGRVPPGLPVPVPIPPEQTLIVEVRHGDAINAHIMGATAFFDPEYSGP